MAYLAGSHFSNLIFVVTCFKSAVSSQQGTQVLTCKASYHYRSVQRCMLLAAARQPVEAAFGLVVARALTASIAQLNWDPFLSQDLYLM